MVSELNHSRGTERGFTLVELLTVIFIIGLTGSLVVFNMPSRASAGERALNIFEQDIRQAADRAILTGRVYAIDVIEDGYQLKTWQDGDWVLFRRPQVRPDAILDIRVRSREEDADAMRPELIFDPTGVNDPVELEVRARGERFILTISAEGEVAYEPR